jgi:threonine dehydrogenase-like Zn-dependent dehydrogenase
MKAVVWQEDGTVSVGEVDRPQLEEPTDALVRVTRSAICGSDLHLFAAPAVLPGETIGHEFVGVVDEVGEQVTEVAAGHRVVGSFVVPCGGCEACHDKRFNVCPDRQSPGGGLLFGSLGGAQAEWIRMPMADLTLLQIPDDLADEDALFVGDILTTAYYANRLGDVGRGKTVAVQGCGPVGLLAIQVANAFGADRVYAIDREGDRLALAQTFGATPINIAEANPAMALEAELGGGAGVVLDTVGGSPKAFTQALELVAPGGTVVVIGVYVGLEASVPLHELFWKNITVRFGGLCPVPALWREVLALVIEGKVDPTAIISHRMPLGDAVEGYDLFRNRQATKVVLEVSD